MGGPPHSRQRGGSRLDPHAGRDGSVYGDEFLDSVASALPFGRFGTPADVASTVGFLCSDKAAYVSGSFFTVDGGLGASLARLPQGPPT
ncbi:SDR family oxidoreductase [Fodinicola feengrottensis]|uniref:SDR family oxidoreductase n=1 Tax=Fodinicola feengrottensis TaxID=435914 RepID=UPI0013D6797F